MHSSLVFVLFLGVTVTCQQIPELQYLNESVDPCDDFYEFTCGNFKNVHPLPEGQQLWDHFAILQDEIHNLAKDILTSPRDHEEPIAVQKAKAFYTGCVDVHAMEALNNGYSVQVDFINKVHKWPAITVDYDDNETKLSWNALAELTAEYGLSFLFSFSIEPSLFNSEANTIYIERDVLNNPEASGIRPDLPRDQNDFLGNYLNTKDSTSPNALPYFEFLKNIAFRMRDLTGERFTPTEQIISELEDTINYMRTIAADGIIGDAEIPPLAMEPTVAELQTWTDNLFGNNFINWMEYLNKAINRDDVHITDTTVVLQLNTTALYGLLNMYSLSTARQLKNYVIARLLTHMAPDSDQFMRDQWQDFSEKNNLPIYSRTDYCVRKTLGYSGNIDFSLAVTHQYQHYHFDMSKMEKAANLVADLRETFMEVLENTEWMDTESKNKAREKAEKMITLLGYPEEIVEDILELDEYYDDMKVCTWDHFGNAQRLRAFQLGLNLLPIGDKKKRDLWTLSPLEVNAFYNRGNNRVLLPVSMLNHVFFSGKYDLLDYARMGAIIGHEITHGFDKFGKDYNPDGVVVANQWSNATAQGFADRETCFKNQYSKYYIEEINAYVNGNQTLNENLADNGGLSTAYKAYYNLKASRSRDLPNDTNYTSEQLFFIGYGTMWCTEASNQYTAEMNAHGAYSPGRYRVIGTVSNMPEFADAFQCPLGSNMNPAEKCRLW